jgi:hypothetical protein
MSLFSLIGPDAADHHGTSATTGCARGWCLQRRSPKSRITSSEIIPNPAWKNAAMHRPTPNGAASQ